MKGAGSSICLDHDWFTSVTTDFWSQCKVLGHRSKLLNLDKETLHARANVWLGEKGTGSFHPENTLQHTEPLLQQVRRVRLQVVAPAPSHYLQKQEHGGQDAEGTTTLFTCASSSQEGDGLVVDRSVQIYLQNLFPFSTYDAAGGVDLNLTLRFPDHITLRRRITFYTHERCI